MAALLVLIAAVIAGMFILDSNGNDDITTQAPSIIKYILPENEIYADVNSNGKISVCAQAGSSVTVKLGFKEFKAEKKSDLDDGTNLYVANVIFPGTRNEIEALGRVRIICSNQSGAISVDGPKVIYEKVVASATPTEKLTIENKVETDDNDLNDAESSVVAVDLEDNYSDYLDNESSEAGKPDEIFPEPVMIEVVSNRADTWPGDKKDDIFNPSCSALTKGTMAYATGTSSAYDSSKKATRYFYNLSYGRRIPQGSAKIVKTTKADNNINASATVSQKETSIVLGETWHVPYSFSFDSQQYHKGSGKLYNVNDFTAQNISFTFYHTTSVSGICDVANSPVVSEAKWTTDAANKTVTLTLSLQKTGGFYGFSASYDKNGNMVISLRHKVQALSGAVILLDPGHGGKDSGALGFEGQIKECDINFAESVALKNELESRGAKIYLTRYDNDSMSLDQRIDEMYKYKPDMFISVHSNSSVDKTAIGGSVYYYKPMSRPLADGIYNRIINCYKEHIYPGDSEKQSRISRGCNYNPFALTRIEECPSVLIELGFVSNDEECSKLCEVDVREKLAVAIADGIEDYIKR